AARTRLAGAFGSHIDVKYAMILGMIPDCDLFMVASAGNAAGTGARIALLDSDSRRTIEELVRRVEKIETAIEPKFQAHFVAAMGIPHSTEAYPELRKVVQLPEPKAAAPAVAGARGREPPPALAPVPQCTSRAHHNAATVPTCTSGEGPGLPEPLLFESWMQPMNGCARASTSMAIVPAAPSLPRWPSKPLRPSRPDKPFGTPEPPLPPRPPRPPLPPCPPAPPFASI